MLNATEVAMSSLDYQYVYRRNLPHIQPPGATLFVTFRLAGSLPMTLLRRRQAESHAVERRLATLPEDEREAARYQEQKHAFGRMDEALDRADTGPTWLRDPAVARVVDDALRQRDGEVYDLLASTLMPNHVHAVFTPCAGPDGVVALQRILSTLKRSTAWDANTHLGRFGAFWQDETYDHYARDAAELARIVYYVLWNPVKAGLVDDWRAWPWTYWKYAES